jgi:uncharacterized membrane protein YeaQ/YmgE (transglycosylase-associated protein family)
MLTFLWWFVVGPGVGWLTGKLMRIPGKGLLPAIAGLVGAFLVGAVCDLLDLEISASGPGSILIGIVGALVVTVIFCKVVKKDSQGTPRIASDRSYTSYKSRMRK